MSLSSLLAKAQPLVVAQLEHAHSLATDHPAHVLFFSLCDGQSRARVCVSSGPDHAAAWKTGVARCQRLATTRKLDVRWLRIDWVTSVQALRWDFLNAELNQIKRNYFRYGLSFDARFEHAFLEQELNANAMLYGSTENATAQLNIKNFSKYATERFGAGFNPEFSPETPVWRFASQGLFLATDAALADLPGGRAAHNIPLPDASPQTPWNAPATLNSGRRQITQLDPDATLALIRSSSEFLARQVLKNGKFIYGHFPCFGRQIATYNTLRHASSVYAMLEAWELTRSDTLMAAIERAIRYLVDTLIRTYPQPDGGTMAFNVDINGEVKLGANAVSLLALVKYDELTNKQDNRPLMEALALGIAHMQDSDSGKFVHVLNAADLSIKDAFRIIYYDGEAAFGLMRLYGLTQDVRWLTIVEKAFDHFIAARHWKAHDHWLSYCANELTRYKPEEKYFRFGVQNIAGHLDFIRQRETTYPTLLELSMAFEQMLGRIQEMPEMQHVLNGLDIERFHRALHHRAHYLLNGFFWPELAMYFAKPKTIVGSFFIRHHTFRVRIDDIEHYLSGYVAYWKMLQSVRSTNQAKPAPVAPQNGSERRIANKGLKQNALLDSSHWDCVSVLAATSGKWDRAPVSPYWRATGLCIYLPAMKAGNVVALKGRNTKGYVPSAMLSRAPYTPQAVIAAEDVLDQVPCPIPVLRVEDVGQAVLAMGRFARQQMRGRLIGVTGSAGKTTTVSLLSHALRPWGSVGQTAHNANLPHGIAWNLASIDHEAPYVVMEMSIGRMRQNAELVQPDIAIITNIAPAHLEYHKTVAEVASKKSAIFSMMKGDGVAILNRDMDQWQICYDTARERGVRIIHYGSHQECDVRLLQYDKDSAMVTISIGVAQFQYGLGARGEHMAYNSMACVATALALNLPVEPMLHQFTLFRPLGGRGEVTDLQLGDMLIRLIDESYNANPASMRAALQVAHETPSPKKNGRRILILGDMLELGDKSEDYHRGLWPLIQENRPDLALLCGPMMRSLYDTMLGSLPVAWFESVDALKSVVTDRLADGDIVLVKGSGGTKLSEVVTRIKELAVPLQDQKLSR